MKRRIIFVLMIFTFGCKPQPKLEEQDCKDQIIEVEARFAEMVKLQGMNVAFLAFAAEEAVLNRNNRLFKGKTEIADYLNKRVIPDKEQLSWEPDHVSIAQSGDLAYTYGRYQYSYVDSLEQNLMLEGVFHTVWERQNDGTWLYVWD